MQEADQAAKPMEGQDQTTEATSAPAEPDNQTLIPYASAPIEDVNYSNEEFELPDLPTTSVVERLLKSQIVEYLASRFLELSDHSEIRSYLVEILLWRDIRR